MNGTGRRGHRPGRSLLRSLASPDSYGSILVLLVATYTLTVSLESSWARSLILLLQVTTVLLILRVSRAHRLVRMTASVAFVLATLVAIANLFGSQSDVLGALIFAVSALLYLIAPLSILRALVMAGEVDRETVFGAIDVYLLIGFFFAFVYRAIGYAQAGPFFGPGGEGKMTQDMFFSFTTLTTTGYGNLVPSANPGQTFAVMEMLIGQLFLVTAVAKVINAWTPRRRHAAAGTSTDADEDRGAEP
jgi:hypothetical protein